MNTANLQFLSILLISDSGEAPVSAGADYQQVLDSVRTSIASTHADELSAALDNAEAAQTLKNLIYKYASDLLAGSDADLDEISERLYQDMAGLGVLTKYLLDPGVEEINVNGSQCIEVLRRDGTTFLEGPDAFPSTDAALSIIKRMLRMGGGRLLDAQTPHVDSDMESGTRIGGSAKPPFCTPSNEIRLTAGEIHASRERNRFAVKSAAAGERRISFRPSAKQMDFT